MGLPEDQPLPEGVELNIRQATEDAALQHSKHNPSGFTKAYGLENWAKINYVFKLINDLL